MLKKISPFEYFIYLILLTIVNLSPLFDLPIMMSSPLTSTHNNQSFILKWIKQFHEQKKNFIQKGLMIDEPKTTISKQHTKDSRIICVCCIIGQNNSIWKGLLIGTKNNLSQTACQIQKECLCMMKYQPEQF